MGYVNSEGVLIGKFMPLHKGHEFMIDFAIANLGVTHIIVASSAEEDEESGLNIFARYSAIEEKYNSAYVNVHMIRDTYGPAKEYDADGTAIDEDFWEFWVNAIRECAPDAEIVVSSDKYGKELGERLCGDTGERTWMPVDPGREMFNISATEIRKNPIANWDMISKEFRKFYTKRIVVVGPESCGKSTLVKDLAAYFGSIAVPEYGRIVSEAYPQMTARDFTDILDGQAAMNACAVENSNGLVFIDTEAVTTMLYGEEYLMNERISGIMDEMHNQYFDLLVLIPPVLPWVNDGTRVMPNQDDRMVFYEELKAEFRARPHTYGQAVILGETDREKRVELIANEVSKLFDTDLNHFFNKVNNTAIIK